MFAEYPTGPALASSIGACYIFFMSARVLRKTVLARELPPEWRQEGEFAASDLVTVSIEPAADPELEQAGSLEEIMDIISRRAQARGLTEEKLAEILNEE